MVGTENLKRIVDQICRDKGIDRALLIDAIEEAVRSAVRKKYGNRREIEVQFSEESGEVEVFQYRTVVDEVYDEDTEIALEDAPTDNHLLAIPWSNQTDGKVLYQHRFLA